jgi:hypothetical protein
MLNIAKQLEILHSQDIFLLYMTEKSINIVECSKVFFIYWTLAVHKTEVSGIISYLKGLYQNTAKFL